MRGTLRAGLLIVCGLAMAGAAGCSNVPSPRNLPPGASFAGTYRTNWGELKLRQRGQRVYGQFSGFRHGSIHGEVQGDLLRFKWSQQEHQVHGRGYLQMSADGSYLDGRWGYDDWDTGGRWWARRRGSE